MNARGCVRAVLFLAAALFAVPRCFACPFCNAVVPTFAERRESASVCALAEVASVAGGNTRFKIHRLHQGEGKVSPGEMVEFASDVALQPGDLALILGTEDGDEWRWEAVKVDPASYLYFVKSPSMRVPATERLAYFLPHLDDENADVSADAFNELGRAPLEAVEALADSEVAPKLREWIADKNLPNERRGGYGLMLGLTKNAESRRTNAALLRQLIDAEHEDFRAGFDGVLAGYLLLKPQEALQLIDECFIANETARPGDTRHALGALRFCLEYARGPQRAQVLEVMRHAMLREAVAADVVKDLARAKDWEALQEIIPLYRIPAGDDPNINRSVIGFLKACPTPEAAAALNLLRAKDPDGVAAIERALALPIDR